MMQEESSRDDRGWLLRKIEVVKKGSGEEGIVSENVE